MRRMLLYCLAAMLPAGPWSTSATAAIPTLLGHPSCATATCHGGIYQRANPTTADVSHSPTWNSSLSVWEAMDPHASAGRVLLSDTSRRIAATLDPQEDWPLSPDGLPATDDASYLQFLARRCISCHATVSAAELAIADKSTDSDSAIGPSIHSWLARGVSCESCHGAASEWIDAHVYQSWTEKSPVEQQKAGMRNTANWLTRIESCVRCHVGSRSADGLLRDMNHDLIAAGHPALRFDGWWYMREMRPHWSSDPSTTIPNAVRFQSARWVTLSAAATLSRERLVAHAADSRGTPWPELADYDCFACHHVVQSSPHRAESRGRNDWNPWYTAELSASDEPFAGLDTTQVSRLNLALAPSDGEVVAQAANLERLIALAKDDSLASLDEVNATPLARFSESIRGRVSLEDRHRVASWCLRIQAEAADCGDQLSAEAHEFMKHELSPYRLFGSVLTTSTEFQPPAIEDRRIRLWQLINRN